MHSWYKGIVLVGLLTYVVFAFGQNRARIDSLRGEVNNKSNSTGIAEIYDQIGREFGSGTDSGYYYYGRAERLLRKQPATPLKAKVLRRIANYHSKHYHYLEADQFCQKALEVARATNDTAAVVAAISDYCDLTLLESGRLNDALKLMLEALELSRTLDDNTQFEILMGLANIEIYSGMVDHEKQKERAKELTVIAKRSGDLTQKIRAKFVTANAEVGIASIRHYQEALPMVPPTSNKTRRSILNNISNEMRQLKMMDSSIYYASQAYEVSQNNNDLEGMGAACMNLAYGYLRTDRPRQAKEYGIKAYEYFKKGNILRRQDQSILAAAIACRDLGEYKQSVDFLEQHMILKDSFAAITNVRSLNTSRQLYDLRFATMKDSTVQAQKFATKTAEYERDLLAKEEKLKRDRLFIIFGLVIGMLLLAGAIALYRNLKQQRNLNAIIHQKNTEITDSMEYAKRIQHAILPAPSEFDRLIPDSFIMNIAKDIVAGDFYFLEEIPGGVIFGVGDCTGHGVPGAMVSVVCHNALRRCVREFGLIEPAEILNRTRSIVLEAFEQSELSVSDGMDIALCKLTNGKLEFAGANNPVWIMKKGITHAEETVQIKGDKQPIGAYHQPSPFTNHEVAVEKGDYVIVFSDGYPDQFGGRNGKKLKYKPFKHLLFETIQMDVNRATFLFDKFNEWKADLEQVDDVCILGVRI